MTLVEIEGSSSVKAAGFEGGTIRVLFHSGHFKDFAGRTAAEFEEFLAAESKGRFVHQRFNGQPVASTTTPVDVYEHDPCCSKRLAKALRSNALAGVDVWTCSSCGAEWKAVLTYGIRQWKPDTWTEKW